MSGELKIAGKIVFELVFFFLKRQPHFNFTFLGQGLTREKYSVA